MWWQDTATLTRFVTSVIAGELAALRPREPVPRRPWPAEFPIGAGGLDADSLELLALAASLGQRLQFHRTGLEDLLLAHRTVDGWSRIAERSLRLFDAEITFLTSGSTGSAKPVPHALDDLREEGSALATLVGPRSRVLSVVPCHHIYGFIFTILLPQALGIPIEDWSDRAIGSVGAALQPGDLVIGHPVFWQAFARIAPTVPADVVGVTSTAPCDPGVIADLRAQGVSRIIEIYGASETAGVGWRDEPTAPFQLFAHWQPGATPGELLRRAQAGPDRRVEVQDRLEWISSRHFRVLGRTDGAVQVAGVNVFPDRVAAVLATHPAVVATAVRLMHPHEGTRLKAFIVPRDPLADVDSLRAELTTWMTTALPAPERPKALRFGHEIPVGPMGKPMDWPLADEQAPTSV